PTDPYSAPWRNHSASRSFPTMPTTVAVWSEVASIPGPQYLFFSRMAKLTGDNRFPLDSLSVYRKSHSRFLGDFAVLQSALPSLFFLGCHFWPTVSVNPTAWAR